MKITQDTLQEAFKLCADVGIALELRLRENATNQRLIVYVQLLRRIHSNLNAILCIEVTPNTFIPVNLMYRCILTDTITLWYLTIQDDEGFKDACDRLNTDNVKFIRDSVPLIYDLSARYASYHQEEIISSEQEIFDKAYDKCRDYLDSEIHMPWKVKASATLSTKGMYESIKDVTKDSVASDLYLYWRVLSQTEHFSPIGSPWAFLDEKTDSMQHVMCAAIILYTQKMFYENIVGTPEQ